jgi:dTDP-4-amino-4,6-dideoxygalactose transaminase
MINVTKVHLPPLEDYVAQLRGIWDRAHLTNHGPLVVELEAKLREYLDVPYCFLVANGTLALHIASKALGLRGSILCTPFSYCATVSFAAWEGLGVRFADIDQATWCLDPAAAEDAWQDDISAIVATHVYGNACDVDGLAKLAGRRNVPIIYDAAHVFAAKLQGRSLASFGDISTLSFHATKLFHTGEGGAVVTHDPQLAKRIEYLRNFGHNGPEDFHDYGTNAKVSELHAAMGLCVLPAVESLRLKRAQLCQHYDQQLSGLSLQRQALAPTLQANYAYYPVVFQSESALLKARAALNAESIYPRRYFYPSLNKLPYVAPQAMPIAESIASRVLCLPLWAELEAVQITRIANIIRRALA